MLTSLTNVVYLFAQYLLNICPERRIDPSVVSLVITCILPLYAVGARTGISSLVLNGEMAVGRIRNVSSDPEEHVASMCGMSAWAVVWAGDARHGTSNRRRRRRVETKILRIVQVHRAP